MIDQLASVDHDPDIVFSALIEKLAVYLTADKLQEVRVAYEHAFRMHAQQYRANGAPYIVHPIAVSMILADWYLDAAAIQAALLHDVVEDTESTLSDIDRLFGSEVAALVDGVSKIDRLDFKNIQTKQAENFRKIFLAMVKDIRVILIKLADRLHNMRTLGNMKLHKRKRIALETLELYAPIANRLGLHLVFQELQDLAFLYLYPLRYRVLDKAMARTRGERDDCIVQLTLAMKEGFAQAGLTIPIQSREKHLYSIYCKMRANHLAFSGIHDIFAMRVLLDTDSDCYLALGILHALYKPLPGKFKDYIALPKNNGYRSLHSTVFGPSGHLVEVQLRTHHMNYVAENGIAAHWMYKEGMPSLTEVQKIAHTYMHSLLELQGTFATDSEAFLESAKIDLFPDEVYVFTPKGEIKSFPFGSTALDFAYAIHTDIGHRSVSARINGQLMPLRTILNSGDRVEILAGEHPNPKKSWLTILKTGRARSAVRYYLKNLHRDHAVVLGRTLLSHELRHCGVSDEILLPEVWQAYLATLSGEPKLTKEDVLAQLGLGQRLALMVARGLMAQYKHHQSRTVDLLPGELAPVEQQLFIAGVEGFVVQCAHCCLPLPGDDIVGLFKENQGLLVHHASCQRLQHYRFSHQLIEVDWQEAPGQYFPSEIRILAHNIRGILSRICVTISSEEADIENIHMCNDDKLFTTIFLRVYVRDRRHLAGIFRALRRLVGVLRIVREVTHLFRSDVFL